MCYILPNDGKVINDIKGAMNMDNFNTWMSSMNKQEVKIYIPKFKFGYKELLNAPLKNMGLGVAFSDLADFTGINPDGNLYISRVIHQSFVDVNEKGTEAAAATVVEVGVTSAGPEIPVFMANKPFIFVIREKSSNAILFMGKVGLPEYEE
jgi:serine protease inhibitor